MPHKLIRASLLLLTLGACASFRRAPAPVNTPELPIVSDTAADSLLVDVQRVDSSLVVELRYATSNNFTGAPLPGYQGSHAYLRDEVAVALSLVNTDLHRDGFGLKIFDAYRPYGITEKMWAPKNVGFVADPAKGSKHNRGAAVDLTVIDLNGGQELEMPSAYDEFTDRAHRDYMASSTLALANRAKLEDVMKRHGFEPLPTEWWHFDFGGWQRFDLMDVPLQSLEAREHR